MGQSMKRTKAATHSSGGNAAVGVDISKTAIAGSMTRKTMFVTRNIYVLSAKNSLLSPTCRRANAGDRCVET